MWLNQLLKNENCFLYLIWIYSSRYFFDCFQIEDSNLSKIQNEKMLGNLKIYARFCRIYVLNFFSQSCVWIKERSPKVSKLDLFFAQNIVWKFIHSIKDWTIYQKWKKINWINSFRCRILNISKCFKSDFQSLRNSNIRLYYFWKFLRIHSRGRKSMRFIA